MYELLRDHAEDALINGGGGLYMLNTGDGGAILVRMHLSDEYNKKCSIEIKIIHLLTLMTRIQ